MVFDEETAEKLAAYLYDNTNLVLHDAEDLAWNILDNLVSGEWEADTSKGYSYPVDPVEPNNGRIKWQETTND